VGQKVLEAVFGDAAVRALAARAREDLLDRVDRLYAQERARFAAAVDAASPPQGQADALRDAVRALGAARRAGAGA
jgi:indole-3-glycerol phosphate synthase